MITLRKSSLTIMGMAFLGIAASLSASAQQTIYAIANGGTTLISFQSNNPGATTVVGNFGGADSFLDAIDFRPATGQLYGYRGATGQLYTINLTDAFLTAVGAPPVTSPSIPFQPGGLDFNPTIDRVRFVNDAGQNVVFNPNTGATQGSPSPLAYGAGDVNAGVVPQVVDNAYTNNLGNATTTTQYGIDYGTDSLVTIANNAGTLTTVGALGVDTDIFTGFDIFTDLNGVNTAYALLDSDPNGGAGTSSLYTINLGTGAATLVGGLGGPAGAAPLSQIYSLAVVPTAVPEPGTVALLAGGVTTAGFALLRRRKASHNK